MEHELYDVYSDNVDFKNGLAISYSKPGDTHISLGHLHQTMQYFEQALQLIRAL